jgi:hypothetical protein
MLATSAHVQVALNAFKANPLPDWYRAFSASRFFATLSWGCAKLSPRLLLFWRLQRIEESGSLQ